MLAVEVLPGMPWQTLAADREVTRLGASVFENGQISIGATDAVCSVLSRTAASWSNLDLLAVRAVATSAVRDAGNQAEFVQKATDALGVPVEVISGQEEARLIHLGVQSRWPQPDGRVLIIDVGGGSAEFIVGEKGELTEGMSRPLGAVRLTEVFLRHDPPSEIELHRLDQFIDEKFAPVLKKLKGKKFDRVIATSASAAAIVSAVNRIDRVERDMADKQCARIGQIRKLYRQLSTSDISNRRKVNGVGPRRAEIIVAGVAVFRRTMELLGLDSLHYSSAGLRDGIVADLSARGAGRSLTRLSRQQIMVVEDMCRKYHVNVRYARHVAHLSSELFEAFQPLHHLAPEMGRLLQAAAYLHDAGHFVSDIGHHKHSAYIVASSDLPGFTDSERRLIAMLCRYHRKSLPQTRHDAFRNLAPEHRRAIVLMTPLLRLAVALDTSQHHKIGQISCNVTSGGATLRIDGEGDLGLEIWAAERAADTFRQAYEVPLMITRLN
ncbi:MAG: Ppx/GppA family phosphatase [Bryobacteraceae bacterium]|nr:Ppx/GppA family phosphatase [Bryobacteraceae bacterium]